MSHRPSSAVENVRTPLLRLAVFAVLLSSALAATPRYLGLGRVSLLGLLTAALVAGAAVTVLCLRGRTLRGHKVLILLSVFVCLDVLSMLWTPITQTGLQDSIVWTGVLLTFILGLRLSQLGPASWRMVRHAWYALFPVTLTIAVIQWASGQESATTPLVLGLSVCLGGGIWASRGGIRGLGLVAAGIALSLLLLARGPALAAVLCMYLAVQLSSWQSRGLKTAFSVVLPAIGLGGIVVALVAYPPLFGSMFGGDGGFRIGGISINTSGRIYWWAVVLASGLTKPILGHGIDVAPSMVGLERWNHPHNDFLRLFHHAGIVGLMLWITAWAAAARAILRHIARVPRTIAMPEFREVSRVAVLMIAFLSLTMLTDNVIVYSYVILPIALVTGMAIGSGDWVSGDAEERYA